MDGDSEGDEVKDRLNRDPFGSRLIDPKLVVQVSQASTGTKSPIDLESLVPLDICALAARAFARDVLRVDYSKTSSVTAEAIRACRESVKGPDGKLITTVEAAEKVLQSSVGPEARLDKTPFAKAVVQLVDEARLLGKKLPDLASIEANFQSLLTILADRLRVAERQRHDSRLKERLNRTRKAFLDRYETRARREQGKLVLTELEEALDDNSPESDQLKAAIQAIRRRHHLDEDLTKDIDDFAGFKVDLGKLEHAGKVETQSSIYGQMNDVKQAITSPSPASDAKATTKTRRLIKPQT